MRLPAGAEAGTGRRVSFALSLIGVESGGERSQRQALLGASRSSGAIPGMWGQRNQCSLYHPRKEGHTLPWDVLKLA